MRSSFVRATTFQSADKFLPGSRWFLGSLEFVTDKFGDLSLQEPELSEVTGSGTDRLPLDLVRVDLTNDAQLGHRLNSLGEVDSDPARDKANHTLAVSAATTDPVYQLLSESDSEKGVEVYMVGQGDPPPAKTTEEINWEAEEEMAQATRLARELDKRKGHNGLQNDFGALEDETGDVAPSRRHHRKFNSWCHADRV
jgi:hypothetical protein